MIQDTTKLLISCLLKTANNMNPDQLVFMSQSAGQGQFQSTTVQLEKEKISFTDRSIMHLGITVYLNQKYAAYFKHLGTNC